MKINPAVRCLAIALAAGALGCLAPMPPRADERADPAASTGSVGTSPAAVDLSGTWTTGSTGEPDVAQIVVRPECNYRPPVWLLEQKGDSLRAWTMPASRTQGVVSGPVARIPAAMGRVSGVDVVLRMTDATYVLRYDSTSGHIRGTLNSAPFWAVRQVVVRPPGCIPPP